MDSKSGNILIDNEFDRRSQHSDVTVEEIQTDSQLVQTSSSDISTLTQTLEHEEEVLDSGCQTPTEFIFNSFAPGPEELCLAPKRKHCTGLHLRRQLSLSFDLSEELEREFEEFEKEQIQNLCKSFLDLIISDVLEICEDISSSEEEGFKTPTKMPLCKKKSSSVEEEGFKTPTDVPLLTGLADSCPGAPIRPNLKQKIIKNAELCRKLDF